MKEFIKTNKNNILLCSYAILFAVIIFNFQTVYSVFMNLIDLFEPLLFAIGIAFILNIPMRKIERFIRRGIKENSFFARFIRGISIIITLIFALILLYLLLVIIVPKVSESLGSVFNNFGNMISLSIESINDILEKLNVEFRLEDVAAIKELQMMSWKDIFEQAIVIASGLADGVVSNAISFTNTFFEWFLAFCLSIYLLAEKEKFIYQLRKTIASFCSIRFTKKIFKIGKQANFIFTRFVGGQLVDCAIKGAMFYIVFIILNMPLPELNATIITVCSIVPVFGPIFAMCIVFVLIFPFDPMGAVWFIVIFQILSNLEAQIIYPKIVGKSIGLPGIWVLLSIFVLGDLLGLLGMVLAVPITALAYAMFTDFINARLKKKNLRIVEDKITKGYEG